MKKVNFIISVFLLVSIFGSSSLFAQKITREQADEIVINYVKNEVAPTEGVPLNTFLLYVDANTPNEGGFAITTSSGETVRAKYACWVYYLPYAAEWAVVAPAIRRYLFVKEDNGSLLEIIVNDFAPNLDLWSAVDLPSGFAIPKENKQSLYPNPVDDWLTLPCNGKPARVEIYDLKGTRLFSGTLSEEDACQINVSFLNAGAYMINVDGKMYKIIKR